MPCVLALPKMVSEGTFYVCEVCEKPLCSFALDLDLALLLIAPLLRHRGGLRERERALRAEESPERRELREQKARVCVLVVIGGVGESSVLLCGLSALFH